MSTPWKSFKHLFGTSDKAHQEEDKAVTELADQYGIPLLNERSQRAQAPAVCAVPLWEHQKAMLARCRSIEAAAATAVATVAAHAAAAATAASMNRPIPPAPAGPRSATCEAKNSARYEVKENAPKSYEVPIGVMNDLPGSGKTYAILSLLADSKDFNLIVVPQNIFVQWETAIRTMFPDQSKVKYKCISAYGDIMDIYRMQVRKGEKNPLQEFNIILVNDLFAEHLAMSIVDNKIPVQRLLIDEIDSVQSRLSTPIPCKHLWLVSASFKYEDGMTIGPYKIKKEDIRHVFCKCEAEFIAKGLRLEEPTSEKIVCEDSDIQLFTWPLTEEISKYLRMNTDVRSALHAGDERPLYQLLEIPYRRGEMSLYEAAMKYVEATKEIEKEIQEYKALYDEHKIRADGSEDSFYQKMKRAEAKRMVRDNILRRLSVYVAPELTKRKWAQFDTEIVAKIQANPDQRWLIFNDNTNAIEEAATRLKEKGVQVAMLDGGNAVAIQRTIDAYKGGTAQVLLLNSKMEAVGMNLENTTHLLFMHAARPHYVEQIVGRAQRYGRVGKLHILALFNASENPA